MIIKSCQNLCSNYDTFSTLAHETQEPIYITKDGDGDLVLMSIEAFEKITAHSMKLNIQNTDTERNINMTEFKLGSILKEMYQSAPRGQQVANIHLFGICYSSIMEQNRLNKKEILKAAGIPESYQTEISKGISLAAFVDLKSEQALRIQKIEESLTV